MVDLFAGFVVSLIASLVAAAIVEVIRKAQEFDSLDD